MHTHTNIRLKVKPHVISELQGITFHDDSMINNVLGIMIMIIIILAFFSCQE